MRNFTLAVAVLLGVATPMLNAVPVHVAFRTHEPRPLRVALNFESATGAGRLAVEQEASAGGADVQLAPGHWCVSPNPELAWFPDRCFDVAEAAGNEVALDVWPSGVILGAVATSDEKHAPAAITVSFEGRGSDSTSIDGSVECAISADTHAFRCFAPAGALNARFHARHFISHYRFGILLDPVKEYSVGTLQLIEGSSISGRVEVPRDVKKLSDVVVTVRSSNVHPGNGPVLPGALLMSQSTTVEKNGWFHVDGLLPGEYHVVAKGPKLLRSNEYEVTVRPGAETELRDVLRLEQPHHITLRIDPPVAFDESQWHVSLSRELVVNRFDTVAQSVSMKTGVWESPLLQPGRYVVEVRDLDRGSVWATEHIEIGSRHEERSISITPRNIIGTVRLGDQPLQANLTFSDAKRRSLVTKSGEDGRFSLILPDDADAWDVLVRGDEPSVMHAIHSVSIREGGTMDLSVPATSLGGIVQDESGQGVMAFVTINASTPADTPVQQFTTHADGTFETAGLTSADYVLSAETPSGRSDPLRITFREDALASVKLTIHKARQMHGRVVSKVGSVAGAMVTIIPTDIPVGMMTSVMTDANGMFTYDLPMSAHEANVFTAAPGFAYTLDHIEVRDQLLVVMVTQSGGSLTLQSPVGTSLLLRHGAVSVGPTLIAAQWTATSSVTDRMVTLTVPMMEPGPYSLCATDGHCVAGVLDPYGALTLSLP